MSDPTARVDLAHEAAFALGRLAVRPSTREVVCDDGTVEVLEPRVMQVLVALHRAGGGIVSRDDLTRSCWEGRVVGEDAINRVISRLRRTAEATGAFRIETVTKVGYRLVLADGVAMAVSPVSKTPDEIVVSRPGSRRGLVGAGLGAGALALAGGWWWTLPRPASLMATSDPQIVAMMQAGYTNMRQTTGDGALQARGIFHRVTELAPDYAEGWGALASVYAAFFHYQQPEQAADSAARAREAIARARDIQPHTAGADIAEVMLLPFNDWLTAEQRSRALLRAYPDNDWALQMLGRTLARVGRMGEAADALTRALSRVEASPINAFDLMSWQWAAGRNDAADRTIARAMALFPRNFAVWFGTLYIRLYSGRVDEAIAMAENVDDLPATIPDAEIASVLRVARALKSRAPAEIAIVRREQLAAAHQATGYAENAMQSLSALGLADDAMIVAEAYFLGRGFQVPSIRFPRGQGSYSRPEDRRTWFLFYPVTAPLRAHPRFPALLRELKLERYWTQSGTLPDYRRG